MFHQTPVVHDISVLDAFQSTLAILLLYLHGTLVYDGVHALTHARRGKRFWPIRLLAKAHAAHHQWFSNKLTINDKFLRQNLLLHLPMEVACQALGAALGWAFLYPTSWRRGIWELATVLLIQACRTAVVAWNAGRDSNHVPLSRAPKDTWSFFVGPGYHALHHVDPANFYGSTVRVVDWALGTSTSLRGRRVTITGAGGALGGALVDALKDEVRSIRALPHEGGWSVEDHPELEKVLQETDILILSHGTKDADAAMSANCTASVALIEAFRAARGKGEPSVKMLPEVWYVGSEAEVHGSWTASMDAYVASKRAFAEFARGYYDAEDIVYRHIVPAAFASRMGPGLVSARWMAGLTVWSIRRGARYVPVTYTGFALLGYFRFLYFTKARRYMK